MGTECGEGWGGWGRGGGVEVCGLFLCGQLSVDNSFVSVDKVRIV